MEEIRPTQLRLVVHPINPQLYTSQVVQDFFPQPYQSFWGDYLSSNKPTTVQTLIWDTQNSPQDDQELPRNPEQNVKNPGNAKVVSLTKHTIDVVFN